MWCNTQCKHISLGTQRANTSQEPQGSGLSASKMEVSFPPSSQAPWRPLCIGGSISVAGQTGFVPRSGHQETPVMGEGCPQLCTYRCLQWHGGQFPLPLRLAASNGNAHSHEELKSPHLLKMSKHRGTALGIRILISEITVSVINPYIYLLIFYLRNPFYVHYFIRASLPLYPFIR